MHYGFNTVINHLVKYLKESSFNCIRIRTLKSVLKVTILGETIIIECDERLLS